MNPTLRNILETNTVRTPDGEQLELRDHVSHEEGLLLQSLVTELRPQVTLEIGLAFGVSALFILEALAAVDGSRHIAIDPLQESLWKNAGLHALHEAGYGDLVDFLPEASQQALPRLAGEGRTVDFAFVDGMHLFDYALVDFFYIDQLLRVGGVVAFDDADLPAVRRVCRFALTNRGYRVVRCLSSARASRHGRALAESFARLPGANRVAKPDLVLPDPRLGLVRNSRCVALAKPAEDQRAWNFHADF